MAAVPDLIGLKHTRNRMKNMQKTSKFSLCFSGAFWSILIGFIAVRVTLFRGAILGVDLISVEALKIQGSEVSEH